ncbi:unnamed protein product [Didymodactylos carnosus]|uniref:IC97/Casc1 N-terminal domain-containing protein n=1 Tax=Didymodactylos carnosus TaxID=1234261 RepID=A0A8S2EAX8_9BILA|nr:unnamed protein product [Didymodactylos carnosus]CAF3857496.1 unnamed protein product [Didymodactylos carnosus]
MATPMKSGTRSSEKSAAPSAKTKKKKEEEERKKREEEDARIKAETADKERAENEKRIAQEKTSLAKEINELRRRELTEFYEFIKPRRQEAHEIKIKQREAFKWKRVLQCDGTPDPTVLPEINTYMSLWRDEQKNTAIENTMDQTNLVLSISKAFDVSQS